MRDALVAALTFDTFHRHADKVAMANIAQLVNCLQSLFIAHDDQCITTPTYHVFDLYGAHVGGQSVRTVVSAPAIGYQRPKDTGSVLGLSGSASVKDKTLTLTVANPHFSEAQEIGDRRPRRGAWPNQGRAARQPRHPGTQHLRAAERRRDQGRDRRHRAERRAGAPLPGRVSDAAADHPGLIARWWSAPAPATAVPAGAAWPRAGRGAGPR